jgi:hypothetical protein
MKDFGLGWSTAPVVARLSTGCFVKPHFAQLSTKALPSPVFLGSRREPHVGQNSKFQNPSLILS